MNKIINCLFFLLLGEILNAQINTNVSYKVNDCLEIYEENDLVIKIETYLVNYSKNAFVGREYSKEYESYFCYDRNSNVLYHDLSWANTNDYGTIIKQEGELKKICSDGTVINLNSEYKYATCLSFGFISYNNGFDYLENLTSSYKISNERINKTRELYLTYYIYDDENHLMYIAKSSSPQSFLGGIVFKESGQIKILNEFGNIISYNYEDFYCLGDYLILFNPKMQIIIDSEFNEIYKTKNHLSPVTCLIDNQCVMLDRKKNIYYLFNLTDKTLRPIKSYEITFDGFLYE